MQSVADTITQKMDQLINDMKSKAQELPPVFDAIRGSMVSSGEYAMGGLAVGLENGPVKHIQKRNKSPITFEIRLNTQWILIHRRVMRDEVGRWIPAGIAVGMERNADVVDSPLQRIKQRIAGYDFSATICYEAGNARLIMA